MRKKRNKRKGKNHEKKKFTDGLFVVIIIIARGM